MLEVAIRFRARDLVFVEPVVCEEFGLEVV
jgi:hypothetical protein